MSRRPAAVTQADVLRTIRAAKQAGASGVEVRPDGTIMVVLDDKLIRLSKPAEKAPIAWPKDVVL